MNSTHEPGLDKHAAQTQALKETLEQTRQEYEMFAGRIAHDLHAVLRNIEGFAAALDQQCSRQLDDKGRHFMQRIRDNAVRGTGLIESLLSYDLLASSPMTFGPVDLRKLLERTRQRAEQEQQAGAWTTDSPPLPVEWRIAGVFPPVAGDAAMLEQALVALLSNALAFRRDGIAPAITITGLARQGLLEVRIADNGIGLDPTEIHRLFQPFERMHEGHPDSGVGMGLACVRRIAERHGGSVAADGLPGQGSVFTLALPLAPGEAAPGPAGAGQPLRILLIDDDPHVLTSVQAMLERLGHKVTSASGGIRGLISFDHALRHLAFDLVITDWGMPQVGGGRVVQALRKISPATPVVVLTGRPPVGEEAADLSQVELVLYKPLRLNQLRLALETVRSRPPS